MIRVVDLSKSFRLYKRPSDRLRELALGRSYHLDHRALDRVSFDVQDGQTIGVVGCNGAGKSTLLKILTGVLMPDSGRVDINGKITGLLELGTGFNSELTGLQNIRDNGLLLGMSRGEIEAKMDLISEFSELGEFVHEPIKTYSSGMVMRLGFAIAIHAEPKCFVVDEALSVGDAHFQQKCMKRINEFRDSGGSIVFVSHDMNSVKVLCDHAVLLDRGKIVEQGSPDQVVNTYNFLVAKMADRETRPLLRNPQRQDYGTLEAEILNVTITGHQSRSSVLAAGERATIEVHVRAQMDIDAVTSGILIRDKFGQDIFGTNTHLLNRALSLRAGHTYMVYFQMQMDLGPGKYSLTAAIHTGETHGSRCFHWHDQITDFEIAGTRGARFTGICRLRPTVSLEEDREYA